MSDVMIEQREVPEAEDAARRERFPVGAQLTFDDMELPGREHVLDELREREPVSWVPSLGGWLVTSREAARAVLRSREARVQANQNLVRASLGRMMLTVDADEHRRQRAPFDKPFKIGAATQAYSGTIEQVAADLLEPLVAQGRCELGEDFAAPFAVTMAARMLGISLEDTALIADFYAAFAAAMVYDGDPAPQLAADRARDELNGILHAELGRVRRTPDVSVTASVAQDSQGLTDDEIVAQLRVIMFGAIETVQASTMNTLLLLLQHPTDLAATLGDPSLIPQACEEAGRLIPPVAFVERWTAQPLTVAGVEIPQDEFVGVSVLAANRDPETFENPTAFDLARENSVRALSFSFGPHTCLGMHLARLETTIAVGRILGGLKNLTLESYEEPGGFAFRRPPQMHLAWSAS